MKIRRLLSARRSALVCILACGLIVNSAAQAAQGTGTIQQGHPLTLIDGVTEGQFVVNRCAGAPASQGVDAYVIDLGANTHLSLSSSSSLLPTGVGGKASYSLNFTFYNNSCHSFAYYQGVSVENPNFQRTSWPYSTLPLGSRWVVVSADYGSNISLTYDITP